MQKKESKFQNFKNKVVGIVCVIDLMLVCSEPADGTSFDKWFLWEIVFLVVFLLCVIYLNKHLPKR